MVKLSGCGNLRFGRELQLIRMRIFELLVVETCVLVVNYNAFSFFAELFSVVETCVW